MEVRLVRKLINHFTFLRRHQISQCLLACMKPRRRDTCLELGGPTPGLTGVTERFQRYLVLNIDREFLLQAHALCSHSLGLVLGDACKVPLKNASVDYVVSNSLVEHIPPELRPNLAREVMRVARKGYFITAPNYWFPFEPHYYMPFFQFLPESFKRRLVQRVRIGWITKESYEPIALPTKQEFARLFPRANIAGLSFTHVLPETLIAWQRFDGGQGRSD